MGKESGDAEAKCNGVKALSRPGRYGDGNGLYLNIAVGGSKSWVQRITIDGAAATWAWEVIPPSVWPRLAGGLPITALRLRMNRTRCPRDAIIRPDVP